MHTTGPAVRNHISSGTARKFIAIYPIMYHLWFLVYKRVLLPPLFRLLLHHLHHKISFLMSTDTPQIQYHREVGVRVKSYGETRPKRHKEIYRMHCLIGYKNSERIWLMKVLQQSFRKTQSKEVKTLPSHLGNFQWSREQKWKRVRVSTVYIRSFQRTSINMPWW